MTDQVQDFQVHVRYDGRSYEFAASQLDVGNMSTDEQVKGAVANELNVPVTDLSRYEVERHTNGNVTLHPQATFGLTTLTTEPMVIVYKSATFEKSKREIQNFLWEEYVNGNPLVQIETWVDNPFTAVKIIVNPPLVQSKYVAYGFSKLCRYVPHAPGDKWDAQFGKDLALKKAIAKVAKKFANEQ